MKILIVDDNILFRQGLSYVLQELEERITILEAVNFERAMLHVSANPDLDLVLLDLNMLGKDGHTVLDVISKTYPTTPVVILSTSNQQSDIQHTLNSGAMGYIPKDSTSTVMQHALRLVLSGSIYKPPNMTKQKNTSLPI